LSRGRAARLQISYARSPTARLERALKLFVMRGLSPL
jgi:hypothetical protein